MQFLKREKVGPDNLEIPLLHRKRRVGTGGCYPWDLKASLGIPSVIRPLSDSYTFYIDLK